MPLAIVDTALTFDDVLLLPGHSKVLPNDVDLSSQLTKKVSLKIILLKMQKVVTYSY